MCSVEIALESFWKDWYPSNHHAPVRHTSPGWGHAIITLIHECTERTSGVQTAPPPGHSPWTKQMDDNIQDICFLRFELNLLPSLIDLFIFNTIQAGHHMTPVPSSLKEDRAMPKDLFWLIVICDVWRKVSNLEKGTFSCRHRCKKCFLYIYQNPSATPTR